MSFPIASEHVVEGTPVQGHGRIDPKHPDEVIRGAVDVPGLREDHVQVPPRPVQGGLDLEDPLEDVKGLAVLSPAGTLASLFGQSRHIRPGARCFLGELNQNLLTLHRDRIGQEAELVADAGYKVAGVIGTNLATKAQSRRGGEGLEVGKFEAEERHAGRNFGRQGGTASSASVSITENAARRRSQKDLFKNLDPAHDVLMKKAKGIYCLEIGEWYGSMKEKTSVEPMLELLRQSPLRVPFIHRDIATEGELRFYLSKWVQGRHRAYPILYLAFHGSPGCIHLNKENGRPATLGTDELFSQLEGKCKGRIVHFGACSVLDVHGKTMNRYLAQSGASAISGFRNDVDWTQAAFLEMLYLSELQHNQFIRTGIRAVEHRVNTIASKLGKSLRFRICIK